MFNCIQYRFGCKLSLLSIFPLGENPHLKRSWFWYSRLRVWMPGVHLPSAKSYRCPCKNWAGQKIGTHTLTLMIDSYWWLKENLKNGEKKRSSSSPFFSLRCFHPNHLLRAWLLSQSLATALLPFPSGNPSMSMHASSQHTTITKNDVARRWDDLTSIGKTVETPNIHGFSQGWSPTCPLSGWNVPRRHWARV